MSQRSSDSSVSRMGAAADEAELKMCMEHWSKMTAKHRRLSFDQPKYPTEVVREAVEENTGERFRFVEPLEVYADFVPDVKPADAMRSYEVWRRSVS